MPRRARKAGVGPGSHHRQSRPNPTAVVGALSVPRSAATAARTFSGPDSGLVASAVVTPETYRPAAVAAAATWRSRCRPSDAAFDISRTFADFSTVVSSRMRAPFSSTPNTTGDGSASDGHSAVQMNLSTIFLYRSAAILCGGFALLVSEVGMTLLLA